MLCGISCELAGCVHRPIVEYICGLRVQDSRLSLATPAKLNFFKTPASEDRNQRPDSGSPFLLCPDFQRNFRKVFPFVNFAEKRRAGQLDYYEGLEYGNFRVVYSVQG
jgi:hypothetical protein